MNEFVTYLQNKSFAESSIKSYQKCLKKYTNWLNFNNQKPNQIDYSNFLNFIKLLQKQNYSVRSINYSINVVKHYYNHLVEENKALENPAIDIRIKGAKKTVIKDVVKSNVLEELAIPRKLF